MSIQWFPGHMAKAKRKIAEMLTLIDVVLETVDARAPLSSYNDDLNSMLAKKVQLKILTKSDLASPKDTKAWINYFTEQGIPTFAVDSLHRVGLDAIKAKLKEEQQKISEVLAKKGRRPRSLRILVAGIPNVGKSSIINALVKRDVAKTADVPGFTKGNQWIRVDADIDLLDTPGIMPPKFESGEVGLTLAALGSIKSEVFSEEDVAFWLLGKLRLSIPGVLQERYSITTEVSNDDMLEIIAKKIGAIYKGNTTDTLKAACHVLKEFQNSKLGKISLEKPS